MEALELASVENLKDGQETVGFDSSRLGQMRPRLFSKRWWLTLEIFSAFSAFLCVSAVKSGVKAI